MNSPLHALMWLAAIAIYFTPTIVAWTRHAPHRMWVTVINVFLGWSVIGWIVALVMSFRARAAKLSA